MKCFTCIDKQNSRLIYLEMSICGNTYNVVMFIKHLQAWAIWKPSRSGNDFGHIRETSRGKVNYPPKHLHYSKLSYSKRTADEGCAKCTEKTG